MKASVVHETVLPNKTSVAVLNPTEIPARQKEERFLAAKRIDRPSSPRLNLELKPLKQLTLELTHAKSARHVVPPNVASQAVVPRQPSSKRCGPTTKQ